MSKRSRRNGRVQERMRKYIKYLHSIAPNCFWCGHLTYLPSDNPELDKWPKKFAATADHYIPLSKGGNNKHINIVLSCKKCNNIRGNALPSDLSWQTRGRKKKHHGNKSHCYRENCSC
jgi:5-methylcytosine-specific restriction endonuclease McrA